MISLKKLLNTLYINDTDRYLSLDGETVAVFGDDKLLGRVPLHNLEGIVTFGYTGASPALMGECAKRDIPIAFMDSNGRFLAKVVSGQRGNVFLRKEQYRISDQVERSLPIAQNFIAAKLHNSKTVLSRAVRDHAERLDTEKFHDKINIIKGRISDIFETSSTEEIIGIEGKCATDYFSLFDGMILQQKNDFYFNTRNRRPPTDNVNALLSFSYSMFAKMCESALETVGLDPYVGFLHKDRSGRASLALDLLEEFRAVYCDRFVLTMINKKILTNSEFLRKENGAVVLTDEGRKVFFKHWQNKKAEKIKHPFLDETVELGMLPYVQALLLARYIRGDLDAYPPFLWK